MAVREVIKKRKSLVIFSQKEIEQEKLDQIFESARWAPSSYNEQPWRFIYAAKTDTENYNKIEDALYDANRKWAGEAPLLIAVLAKTNFSHNNQVNRHAYYDVGQAVATLSLQATELGLYLRQMAGFDTEKLIYNLGIPAGYDPVAVIAMGYEGKVDENTDEKLAWKQNHKRTRKNVDELVKEGNW